jgi:hypothetical protein
MTGILSAFALWPDVTLEGDHRIGDLAALEARVLPERPRRVGRHARLSMLGAAACMQQVSSAPSGGRVGIYLGSALGNTAQEHEVVEQAVAVAAGLAEGPASPGHFAASVSNSATFHVSRATGALGPNLVVSQEIRSFEGALATASLAIACGDIDFALVGGVDELPANRETAWRRLDLDPALPLGEGSAWLLLGREAPRGTVAWSDRFDRMARAPGTLADRVRDTLHPGEALVLLPGPGVAPDDPFLATLSPDGVTPTIDDYRSRSGTFGTAAALALAGAFAPDATPGLHVHLARCNGTVWSAAVRRHPDP